MFNLDLLTLNGEFGRDPDTCYAQDSVSFKDALLGAHESDICIIGGGLTGASAARTLAKQGLRVILLEASRIGSGASGRNGGQIYATIRQNQDMIERLLDLDTARKYFALGPRAFEFIQKMVHEEGLDIGFHRGVAHACLDEREFAHARAYVAYLQDRYGQQDYEVLDQEAFYAEVKSPLYRGGIIHWGGGHGDPRVLCRGMARAAQDYGAKIHEMSRVLKIDPDLGRVSTQTGHVRARHIILATNAYTDGLDRQYARFVMPINNYIITTTPLDPMHAHELIPRNLAVADSKFVVNYFRRTPDNRILFGGGESYGYRFPKDIATKVSQSLHQVFPTLRGVQVAHAWGGVLGITRNRLPYARNTGRLWICGGYSGQGVAMASFSGDMLGRAILGDDTDFNTLASVPHRPFPGGNLLRSPLLFLGMNTYRFLDWAKFYGRNG